MIPSGLDSVPNTTTNTNTYGQTNSTMSNIRSQLRMLKGRSKSRSMTQHSEGPKHTDTETNTNTMMNTIANTNANASNPFQPINERHIEMRRAMSAGSRYRERNRDRLPMVKFNSDNIANPNEYEYDYDYNFNLSPIDNIPLPIEPPRATAKSVGTKSKSKKKLKKQSSKDMDRSMSTTNNHTKSGKSGKSNDKSKNKTKSKFRRNHDKKETNHLVPINHAKMHQNGAGNTSSGSSDAGSDSTSNTNPEYMSTTIGGSTLNDHVMDVAREKSHTGTYTKSADPFQHNIPHIPYQFSPYNSAHLNSPNSNSVYNNGIPYNHGNHSNQSQHGYHHAISPYASPQHFSNHHSNHGYHGHNSHYHPNHPNANNNLAFQFYHNKQTSNSSTLRSANHGNGRVSHFTPQHVQNQNASNQLNQNQGTEISANSPQHGQIGTIATMTRNQSASSVSNNAGMVYVDLYGNGNGQNSNTPHTNLNTQRSDSDHIINLAQIPRDGIRRDTMTAITDPVREITELKELTEDEESSQELVKERENDGNIENTMSILQDVEDSVDFEETKNSTTEDTMSLLKGINGHTRGGSSNIPVIEPHTMNSMVLPTNSNNHKYTSHDHVQDESVWTETNMEESANAKSVRMTDNNPSNDGGAVGDIDNVSDAESNDPTKAEAGQETKNKIDIAYAHKLSAINVDIETDAWTDNDDMEDEKSIKMIDENVVSPSDAIGSEIGNMFGLKKIDESNTGTNTVTTITGTTFNNHQHENTFTETESRSVY